jgi:hypothetical protein
MKEILEFVFQSFWHWLGTVILIATLLPWGGFTLIRFGDSKK